MVRWLADPLGYPAEVQSESGVTYAAKIDKSEARIDWTAGMVGVDRQIRALNPAPGAWFEFNGERIRVHIARILSEAGDPKLGTNFPTEPGLVLDDELAIGCGRGAIRPLTVQRAGRGVMATMELLRGFPIPAGSKLG
jgi:methionyl-tRNA formyltransferase